MLATNDGRPRRVRLAPLLGAGLVAALVVGLVAPSATTAAAATARPRAGEHPFSSSPDQGRTGTVIEAAGDGCVLPGSGEPADGVVVTLVQRGRVAAGVTVAVDDRGSWNGTLIVPAGVATGAYRVRARCTAAGFEDRDPVVYGGHPFTVTGEGPAAPEGITTPPFAGGIEPFPDYDGQSTCSPSVKPGMGAFRTMVMANYGGGDSGITRACNVGGTSEHKEGRAWDWAMNANSAADRSQVEDLFDWLFATDSNCNTYANARRLGIMYVIWNRHILRMYDIARGWAPYTGPVPHTDHVHFSLTRAGGAGETSFWTSPPQAAPFHSSDHSVQSIIVNPSWEQAAAGDFNGDGRDDLLWYDTPGGSDHVWYSAGEGRFSDSTHAVAGGFTPLTGDFNADCVDDVFWYAPGAAADSMWLGRPDRTFRTIPVTVNGTYEPVVGDFNGDRVDDIFWYRPGTGRDAVWYGSVYARFVGRTATVDGTFHPLAGDFNGDGPDDVYWYGEGAAPDALWRGTRDSRFSAESARSDYVSDQPLVGDYNGDQRADIFWYGVGAEGDAIWLGAPSGAFLGAAVNVDGTFAHPVAADVDGNGRDDLLFHGDGTNRDRLWRY